MLQASATAIQQDLTSSSNKPRRPADLKICQDFQRVRWNYKLWDCDGIHVTFILNIENISSNRTDDRILGGNFAVVLYKPTAFQRFLPKVY